jgi:hypothetical protein
LFVLQIQQARVQIPEGLSCPDCTIRLTRQATEWGKSYQFQSCADVDIVAENVSFPDFKNLV